jgi:hypothetical protein
MAEDSKIFLTSSTWECDWKNEKWITELKFRAWC